MLPASSPSHSFSTNTGDLVEIACEVSTFLIPTQSNRGQMWLSMLLNSTYALDFLVNITKLGDFGQFYKEIRLISKIPASIPAFPSKSAYVSPPPLHNGL